MLTSWRLWLGAIVSVTFLAVLLIGFDLSGMRSALADANYLYLIPGAGLWDVSLPIVCDCLPNGRAYLLGFEIVSSSCLPEPDLIIDDAPGLCTSWNNFGSGWTDLGTLGFPGNLVFFTDADCCDTPMPVSTSTWGAIKALYEEVDNAGE